MTQLVIVNELIKLRWYKRQVLAPDLEADLNKLEEDFLWRHSEREDLERVPNHYVLVQMTLGEEVWYMFELLRGPYRGTGDRKLYDSIELCREAAVTYSKEYRR